MTPNYTGNIDKNNIAASSHKSLSVLVTMTFVGFSACSCSLTHINLYIAPSLNNARVISNNARVIS